MSTAGVDQRNRKRWRSVSSQDFHESSALHFVVREVRRRLYEPETSRRGLDQCFTVTEPQGAFRDQRDVLLTGVELPGPDPSTRRQPKQQAPVLDQLGGGAWFSVSCDINSTRISPNELPIKLAPDEVRIGKSPDPDSRVQPFLDHVHYLVGKARVDSQCGVARQQFQQDRQNDLSAIGDGHVDTQRAARLGTHRGCRRLEGFHVFENTLTALVNVLAVLRQGDLPRGAMEQAHAQLRLKPRDILCDRGGRQSELSRRTSKAGMARRRDERNDEVKAGQWIARIEDIQSLVFAQYMLFTHEYQLRHAWTRGIHWSYHAMIA